MQCIRLQVLPKYTQMSEEEFSQLLTETAVLKAVSGNSHSVKVAVPEHGYKTDVISKREATAA